MNTIREGRLKMGIGSLKLKKKYKELRLKIRHLIMLG